MHPIAYSVGPVEIRSFSVAFALALLVSAVLLHRLLPARGMAADETYPLIAAAVLGGVVGARLAYVAAHWDSFADRLADIPRLDQGGLVFYGGLAGGASLVAAAALLRRLKLSGLADVAAVVIPAGAAIGRIGCFLNGCCRGVPTDVPWGVTFPGSLGAVHPTQLYDAAYNVAIFALMAWLFARRSLPHGAQFWLFLALYGVARFAVEALRVQSEYVLGLSGAQVIGAVLVPVALTSFVYALRKRHPGVER